MSLRHYFDVNKVKALQEAFYGRQHIYILRLTRAVSRPGGYPPPKLPLVLKLLVTASIWIISCCTC